MNIFKLNTMMTVISELDQISPEIGSIVNTSSVKNSGRVGVHALAQVLVLSLERGQVRTM